MVNRRLRRDGPLFRGRFRSRPVESDRYWWTLVRYIDFNPPKAGTVGAPAEFPFGSAARYAHTGPWPRWLTRSAIEEFVGGSALGGTYDPGRYTQVFGPAPTEQEVERIERRLRCPHHDADLLNASRPGIPIVTPGTVLDLLEGDGATVAAGSAETRFLLATGTMRDACGLAFDEIARRLGCSASSAHRRAELHSGKVREDEAYAEAAAALLDRALRADHARVSV